MIVKPGWFGRRKYTGWGATPRTWQGWLYVIVLVAPFLLIKFLPESLQIPGLVIWVAVAIVGFVDIMKSLGTDERERIHEAFAERNALWAMITVLSGGIAYQVASGIAANAVKVDPVIIIALIAAVVAKAATNIYLDKKD